MTDFVLFFDGCSKGNPGRAGAGAVIYQDQTEIYSEALFVGEKETNNVAEYAGLILGLKAAVRLQLTDLRVKGDSELVIKHMKGIYQVKAPNLVPLFQEAQALSQSFSTITFQHVFRTMNKRADALSNEGLMRAN
jgi:ribonuclease HI